MISMHFGYSRDSAEDIKIAIEKRKLSIRSKVKSVIPCDALLLNPIAPINATFDVVGSSLMLDCAEGSTYKQRLKNASALVKSGGFFVQFSNGPGCCNWKCGSVFFKVVDPQTPEDNAIALDEAGFNILQTANFELPPFFCQDGIFDCKDMFLTVCRKRY
ncbi:unnamed protein product [Owenia fusiformis]|uniref:Uncharacterized protein n=1 Tax=Owenia fusiformis TaxID=6347 RepID=A0A8J1Y1Z5_OWEFU|nr:unnamed protein product [Owenia fusiformis]